MRRNPNGREPARRQRGTNADGDYEHPSGNQTWITDFAQSSVCRAQLCRHRSRVLFEHERDCSLGPKTDRVESARVNLSISCRMPRPIVCWLPRPFVAHVFLHPAHAKQSEHQCVGGECAIQAKMTSLACVPTSRVPDIGALVGYPRFAIVAVTSTGRPNGSTSVSGSTRDGPFLDMLRRICVVFVVTRFGADFPGTFDDILVYVF